MQKFSCHICHDPTHDRRFGFSPLLIGSQEETASHYKKEHNLYLSADGQTYFPTQEEAEAYTASEERRARTLTRMADLKRHCEMEGVEFDPIMRVFSEQNLTQDQEFALREYDQLNTELNKP